MNEGHDEVSIAQCPTEPMVDHGTSDQPLPGDSTHGELASDPLPDESLGHPGTDSSVSAEPVSHADGIVPAAPGGADQLNDVASSTSDLHAPDLRDGRSDSLDGASSHADLQPSFEVGHPQEPTDVHVGSEGHSGPDTVTGVHAHQDENVANHSDFFGRIFEFARHFAESLVGASHQMSSSVTDSQAHALAGAAHDAFARFPEHCNKSVIDVAHTFGIRDLDGKSANAQVNYMNEHWSSVSATQAHALACGGHLVVAGWANPNPKDSGHVAVVTPGPGGHDHSGTFSPNVTGGGSPRGQSHGEKTAIDVFTAARDIHYYAAPTAH